MKKLLVVLAIVHVALGTHCFIEQEKKDRGPEIHVIHLEEESGESSEPEIVAIHIPDNKRKREISNMKGKISRCPPGQDCARGERTWPITADKKKKKNATKSSRN